MESQEPQPTNPVSSPEPQPVPESTDPPQTTNPPQDESNKPLIETEKPSEPLIETENQAQPLVDESKIYKLHYFKGNCRAMISRAILSSSQCEYRNIIIDKSAWKKDKKLKSKYEFGKLPMLEYRNETISQSIPIQVYLAKKFKLLGNNIEQECKIVTLFLTFEDLIYFTNEVMMPKTANSKDEPKQEYYEMLQKFIEKLEHYVAKYEKMLIKNGNGEYFFSEGFSAADIFFSVVLNYFSDVLQLEKNIIARGPNIWKLAMKVKENQLKNFFEKEYQPGIY